MKTQSALRAHMIVLAAVAAVAISAGVAAQLTGVLSGLERQTVSARFHLRHVPRPTGIVIVAVDDVTFSDLHAQWPFRRSLHATLIDRLHAAGARTIVYDVQFTEPTKPREDLALYRSLERNGGAVLATTEVDASGHTDVLGGDDNLRAAHSVAASSSLPQDPGGVKSHFDYAVQGLRTIGLAAAERAGGPPLKPSSFPRSGAWIDFRGGPGTFPTISFSNVIRRRFDPAAVRGKIVVVGASAPSLQDVHATPIGADVMPGPEVEANAIWTALHGLPLRSLSTALSLLLVAILGAAPAFLGMRIRVLRASLAALALALAYLVGTQIAFDAGAIVPVAAPLVAFLLSLAGAIVGSHAVESRARQEVSKENEDLERRVRDRTRELRDTQLEIVSRLGQAAELRDEDTGEHIARMSHLCHRLALRIGMAADEADTLLHASVMHDVGKIGIPDRILLKPGELDAAEWEVMKSHTTIGAAILSGSESQLLQLAETIALTHHEHWDGGGYPRGLRGEEIPLVGRICAVCDVYDALISERPYKHAWSSAKALAEIRGQSDKQFDRRVVEAFLELVPTGEGPGALDEWSIDPAAFGVPPGGAKAEAPGSHSDA